MSSTTSTEPGRHIEQDFANMLRYNREMAMKLPDAERTFALQETNLSKSELQKLHQAGAIDRVERERSVCETGVTYRRWRWQTVDRVAAWIEDYFDDAPECPGEDCYSTGVRCLEPRERYTCSNDGCTETFGPDVARELIGR
ncbi:hypothetical protein [Natronomonas sp. LN261]|uniref:hypothetical protein n=1 Tax=Natronomonas sp. LN261 TaxID=2750669 RepID=UPI0015EF3454|nr:hypothetical protein [Natronomonas sp. LN261]